jgi:transposase
VAKLDDQLKELARRNEVAWRLMSVPGVGPVTALAFIAAIENLERFKRTRDIGAYLGLTGPRYQSAGTDVGMGISKQGDAMARHYLCEAANAPLTAVPPAAIPRPSNRSGISVGSGHNGLGFLSSTSVTLLESGHLP